MSLIDLQAFLQERIQIFDETIDVGPGSDADTKIVQPMLRRLGPDPFAVDVRAFIMDRLNQEFPDFATSDGDGLTDLLIKPAEILLDPIVRENSRVRNNLSFRDPSILTLDEADSLGANFFVGRELGNFSGGTVRIYFSAPQGQSINPSNYVTSRSGLTFFPTGVQSISVDDMLFNVEGSLYYFDITVTAEKAGDQYNLEVNEVVSIAGVNASVKVTNKFRFRNGIQAEDAPTYIGRVGESITERSMVTKRGITTQLTNAFPEMTRLNVVGFNDPEMQRDIIEGDGVGPIAAAGVFGFALPDGFNDALTRRFTFDDSVGHDAVVDFTQLIGPPGEPAVGWTLTIHGAFLGAPPVKDVAVMTVISPLVLDLGTQVLPLATTGLTWELRHSVLTLSTIPGGILFPNGPNGTVTVPDDQIHIGGCTDIHVRGTVLDQGSLTINVLSDDEPLLSGFQAIANTGILTLGDLILGTNYNLNDTTYEALANAYRHADQIQILTGVGAGIYRILSVTQTPGFSPSLIVTPTPVNFSSVRWRLVDEINVDLVEPKETFITGTDLQTIQGVATVTTASAVNFLNFGVSANDTLRIESGPDSGDFTILQVTPFPNFTQLVLNRAPQFTKSNLKFAIFRPSTSTALNRPMVRISSINLLDQNGQPVGSNIPYSQPVGAFSSAFSHPGKGFKFDIEDALLGIIGLVLTGTPVGAAVSSKILQLSIPDTGLGTQTITFTGANPIPLNGAGGIIAQINAVFNTAGYPGVVAIDAGNRLGILGNIGAQLTAVVGGTILGSSAIPLLFGVLPGNALPYITNLMVRSPEFDANAAFFTSIFPPLDEEYDVFQVIGGQNAGHYNVSYVFPFPGAAPFVPAGLTHPNALVVTRQALLNGVVKTGVLSPDAPRHVQLGARSLGRVRLYFLEPTSATISLDPGPGTPPFLPITNFSTTLPSGAVLYYVGDPAESAQIIPPLPGGLKPTDGSSVALGTTFTSPSSDFVADDVRVGDFVTIDYIPVVGSVALADPVVSLGFTTFIFSIGSSPDITLTFNRDNLALAPTSVSRQGVADEINAAAGVNIASIDGGNHIKIVSTAAFVIRKTGTSNTLLGFSTSQDTNNAAAHAGTYTVAVVTDGQHLVVTPAFPSLGGTELNEQFTITRPGTQRIGTTAMSQNVGPAGFYFMDVELVSEGAGDIYNIDEDVSFLVNNIQSDGYFLTTSDSDLTFSPAEAIELHISKTINEAGTDDALSNATALLGQNIQINYEFSTLTSQIQNFALSDQERVVNESPLARHLIPYFVRFDLSYAGGPVPSDVEPTIETLIQALFPDQQLQVSDIQAILTIRGATSITNPLTLFGIVYNLDRTVSLEMSQDRLNVGRLAAFIPDTINLVRQLT
jgi:hypothetical protein